MGSISCYITPLVINSLEGGHPHTHKHTHTYRRLHRNKYKMADVPGLKKGRQGGCFVGCLNPPEINLSMEQVDILLSKNQAFQILYLKHYVYKTS